MKWPKLRREYVGCRVKLRRDLTNDTIRIPAGAVLTVTGWQRGLTIMAERCACCGIRPIMSRVGLADVELLSVPDREARQ